MAKAGGLSGALGMILMFVGLLGPLLWPTVVASRAEERLAAFKAAYPKKKAFRLGQNADGTVAIIGFDGQSSAVKGPMMAEFGAGSIWEVPEGEVKATQIKGTYLENLTLFTPRIFFLAGAAMIVAGIILLSRRVMSLVQQSEAVA